MGHRLNPEETKKIAKLAHLTLSDEEAIKHTQCLKNILELFDSLERADTSDICHLDIKQRMTPERLREDVVTEQEEVEALAKICCLANLDVSIVYSASKTLDLASFILSTIEAAIAEECLKRLIKAPNFESSLEVWEIAN